MQYILSIDQGTQSTRVFLYDEDAQPVASHQETFKQIYPRQGCVPHPSRMRAVGQPRHPLTRFAV